MKEYNKLIFEISKKGRCGYALPELEVDNSPLDLIIPKNLLKTRDVKLPEVSENGVIRHYTRLSNKNFGLDTGFYPLGSCTMKYNPKINEVIARNPKMVNLHPYQPEESVQGALEMMHEAAEHLAEISGMDQVSLQPAAGSHGEMAGLMLIKAYHEKNGDFKRKNIIVPDSAHGTNPSSVQIVGLNVIEIKSTPEGDVDIEVLKEHLNDELAGFMLTNPSTLGIFEKNIEKISTLIHEAGGLLYYDGANMNAIMGKARPGDMGFDVMHFNLHKTFSTPHGGGGPGAGPIGFKSKLADFQPVPVIEKMNNKYRLNYDRPDSIGKVRSFYGNYGVILRAYAYILTMGGSGLETASETAVLNANYMMARLKEHYPVAVDKVCKHEFILTEPAHEKITTLDIAKRLLDFGYHPPTIYFPLIIKGAMMIEPTETESKETMDEFIETMINIRKEMEENPEAVLSAPGNTLIKRVDEGKAARDIVVTHSW
ncbi:MULTISPECIES: aminomethyl-transferring glycine dehydrogenase subunit GcvPB [Psychrilyobacter]|uniref:Probable glycine dehydrogenase (decarboxylating) subunit 2 n=1 Tax=Psychrilyobacter piezotolerans TaxID=2293438 RepID=A0ABX9KGR0_9FUSO|nr:MULTISPECIES: aminomethyl-transferring glycine dehydrogenase subunit GcvPB [Psychrilyobacter]MCS5422280.1 aminomethyl-transferring glycine dehydrogenase subunit GcvPB [Psychrilyobacter sp. S5]NDI78306.1 glycine dehydrogenase subunit 2 [Psychrilyobacter piezotolerans]RDE60845.1 glycine dehydrogenase subunit 2 [Psychrilyobacter sp. S5]REI40634.1 aminotransferase class V-fold PLP-dependent enzyme [Psychrilyobacter piezotolerans]